MSTQWRSKASPGSEAGALGFRECKTPSQLHVGQRHDGDAGGLQPLADGARHGHAGRLVAVDAQGVDVDLHSLAVAGDDLAVAHHAHRLLAGLVGVLDDGAGDGPGGEVAVVVIEAVREALARQRKLQPLGGLVHLRPVKAPRR